MLGDIKTVLSEMILKIMTYLLLGGMVLLGLVFMFAKLRGYHVI